MVALITPIKARPFLITVFDPKLVEIVIDLNRFLHYILIFL